MPSKYLTTLKWLLRRSRWLQIIFLTAFWFLGQLISKKFNIPIPGSVIGFFLVLISLGSGWIRVGSLALGAEWFLAEMLLFFIPAVPAVINYPEFMGWIGLKILAIILSGTMIVMVGTAYIVDLCFHRIEKHPKTKETP